MLIGLISDIHGNVEALEQALAELSPRVDEILLAGDVMHEYRWCNEVVEIVRDLDIPYVLGNHEMGILGPLGERARSADTVRAHNVEYLRTIPTRVDVKLGGQRVAMVHSTPFEPYTDYLHAASPLLKRCADPNVDILVVGHSHVPMAVRVGPTLVINPGSLGDSREQGARHTVSYAILDTDHIDEQSAAGVEFFRIQNPRLPVPPAPVG